MIEGSKFKIKVMVSTLSGNKIDGSIKKKLKELTVRVINKF